MNQTSADDIFLVFKNDQGTDASWSDVQKHSFFGDNLKVSCIDVKIANFKNESVFLMVQF